jgi:DNA-binding NarL/FixJ family response regulator
VPPDSIALPRALVALLHVLARREPVLVAVDDVQWLDPQSQALVSFAVRRLGEAPVGILTTQRGDGRDPLDLCQALDERVDEIELGALSAGALHQLVRSRLDVRIPRPALARAHSASGGNPMFALEFARSIAERGGPHLGPLPIPESLDELVRERVAGYPLRRANPRPRRDRELTTAERRVASLVAAGRTNREAAAQLFTTVATVEAHLTRIYRKVGLRSRTELARRVADGTLAIVDD